MLDELKIIKRMYYNEGIAFPSDLDERYKELKSIGTETPREKFLVLVTADRLNFTIGEIHREVELPNGDIIAQPTGRYSTTWPRDKAKRIEYIKLKEKFEKFFEELRKIRMQIANIPNCCLICSKEISWETKERYCKECLKEIEVMEK